jgi:PBP1b-binding outer membrane lipoprotein LpoB
MRNTNNLYIVIPTIILFLVGCTQKNQPVGNSNKEMLDILSKVALQNFNKANPFLPEAQFALFSDEMITSGTNIRQKITAQAYKATLL